MKRTAAALQLVRFCTQQHGAGGHSNGMRTAPRTMRTAPRTASFFTHADLDAAADAAHLDNFELRDGVVAQAAPRERRALAHGLV